MKIYGEEYGFALTVGASAEIADLCPDGDLNRIGEVLEGRFSETVNFNAKFIVAMSKGYDDAKKYSGEPLDHRPLTVEMILSLPQKQFIEVQDYALACFTADNKTTVEVEPPKKEVNP